MPTGSFEQPYHRERAALDSVGTFVLCCLLLYAHGAQAQPVSVLFTGTVNLLRDQYNVIPNDVFVGATFSGVVTYEDTTAPDSTAPGLFRYPAITAFSVSFDSSTFTSELVQTVPPEPPNYIFVGNDRGACGCEDLWKARAYGDQDSFPGLTGTMFLSFIDDTSEKDPLDSTALAGQTLGTVSDWRQLVFGLDVSEILTHQDGSVAGLLTKGTISGTLTSFETRMSVPEPSDLVVFAAALLSLCTLRRRTRSMRVPRLKPGAGARPA